MFHMFYILHKRHLGLDVDAMEGVHSFTKPVYSSNKHTFNLKFQDWVVAEEHTGATWALWVHTYVTMVCVAETGNELALLKDGSCFGELALLRQEPRAASVAAVTDGEVLTLHRDQFTKVGGAVLSCGVFTSIPCFMNVSSFQNDA